MGEAKKDSCPFCEVPADRILAENDLARALADGYPVSRGHTLVVPRRHVETIDDLFREEIDAVMRLARETRERLAEEYKPDGFNIGINEGAAAGQTVKHLHVHVIPRYENDVPDPRGGIRRVIPDKADYWSSGEKG